MWSLLLTLVLLALAWAQPHHEDGVSCYDCPGHGPGHHGFPACMQHVTWCHGHENTCQVNYVGNEVKTIRCRHYEDCAWEAREGSQSTSCTLGGYLVQSTCQKCCRSKGCVDKVLHPPTPTPTQVQVPEGLWGVLQGECADQLAGDQCATLYATPAACRASVSLRVCPATCGLCPLFRDAKGCHDVVLHAGCAGLNVTEHVCAHPLGVAMCPVFCGKCDELLANRIDELLTKREEALSATTATPLSTTAESTRSTTVATTTKPTTTTLLPTTPPPTTLLPTTPPPTTLLPTTPPPTTPPPATSLPPKPPAPTSLLPTTPTPTTPSTHPTNTTPSPFITTPTPTSATNPTTATAVTQECEDNLQVGSCADLLDVCSSPVFSQYCRKHCDFCHDSGEDD